MIVDKRNISAFKINKIVCLKAEIYLVEVDDCDEAMRIHVSVETVIDPRQINHQEMSFSRSSVSVKVVDGSLVDQRRSAVLDQGLPCVWMRPRGGIDTD